MLSALILAILPINFTVSAVNNVVDLTNTTTIALPFPSPVSFGSTSKACIVYNSDANRYTMFLLTYTPGPLVGNSNCVSMNVRLFYDDSKTNWNRAYIKIEADPYAQVSAKPDVDPTITTIASDVHLYSYMWVAGSSSYSVAERSLKRESGMGSPGYILFDPVEHLSDTWSYTAGKTTSPYNNPLNYVRVYNGASVSTVVKSNIFYSFSSTDGYQSLAVLRGIDSNVNQIESNVSDISDKLSASNNHLATINNSVVFYCQEILDKLNDGNDYVPEQTTSNADISNYENAEGALMDNNIENLNNFEMPDLVTFNSGSQNNAFKFISSNIEFFSGMNGQGSVAKIATVLFVILGLGLTSFIIGLSNRKKGG